MKLFVFVFVIAAIALLVPDPAVVLVEAAADDEECKDDRDWWFKANVSSGSDPKRTCNAIKKDIKDRCPGRTGEDGRIAWEACRETCGTCDKDWDYGNDEDDKKELQSEPKLQLAEDGEDSTTADNVEKQQTKSSGVVPATVFVAAIVSVATTMFI